MFPRASRLFDTRLCDASGIAARRLALSFVLLAAFCLQSIVVGGHVHLDRDHASAPAASAPGAVATGAKTTAVLRRGQGQAPATACPVCNEAALAGHYLLPTAAPLVLAGATFVWFAAEPLAEVSERQRSHAWNSRGPPRGLSNPY